MVRRDPLPLCRVHLFRSVTPARSVGANRRTSASQGLSGDRDSRTSAGRSLELGIPGCSTPDSSEGSQQLNRMLRGRPCTGRDPRAASAARASNVHEEIALFLCGDVMTGRGIDQLLPRPCEPTLYEPYVTSANEYV